MRSHCSRCGTVAAGVADGGRIAAVVAFVGIALAFKSLWVCIAAAAGVAGALGFLVGRSFVVFGAFGSPSCCGQASALVTLRHVKAHREC